MPHPPVSVLDVAEAVLDDLGNTPSFKLQKLVYYCQAWHLVFAHRPLFPEDFQAWVNGPVAPKLYAAHRGRYLVDTVHGDVGRLSHDEREHVRRVGAVYGKFSAGYLIQMTHDEEPWKAARGPLGPTATSRAEIPKSSMATFYAALLERPDAVRLG